MTQINLSTASFFFFFLFLLTADGNQHIRCFTATYCSGVWTRDSVLPMYHVRRRNLLPNPLGRFIKCGTSEFLSSSFMCCLSWQYTENSLWWHALHAAFQITYFVFFTFSTYTVASLTTVRTVQLGRTVATTLCAGFKFSQQTVKHKRITDPANTCVFWVRLSLGLPDSKSP